MVWVNRLNRARHRVFRLSSLLDDGVLADGVFKRVEFTTKRFVLEGFCEAQWLVTDAPKLIPKQANEAILDMLFYVALLND
uniref:hypothetical protein n=1 Tax=Pseudodesulfovibrio sp. TaxID=2035812 RepID=UPI002580C84E|nr:hypothetical protein [Pseudodesulfovibrio sp.]